MLGMLDSIFGGTGGVANMLLEQFGGKAVIYFAGQEGSYNAETDEYETTGGGTLDISFAQETARKDVLDHVGGIEIQAGDLVGILPSAQLTRMITPNIDKILFNNEIRLIIAVESIVSGNQSAAYRVLANNPVVFNPDDYPDNPIGCDHREMTTGEVTDLTSGVFYGN